MDQVAGACDLLARKFGSPALEAPIEHDPRRQRMFDLAASDVTDTLRDLLRAASYEVTISLQKDYRAISGFTGRKNLERDVMGGDGRRNIVLGEWLASVRDEVAVVFEKARNEVDRQWLLHLQYDVDKAGNREKKKWTRRLHSTTQANLMGRSGLGLFVTVPGILGNMAVNHLYGYVNDARTDSMGLAEEILR